MLNERKAIYIAVLSLFLVILDRTLKFLSAHGVSWLSSFQNDRIAFSLPISWSFFLSVIVIGIMLGIAIALVRAWRTGLFVRCSLFLCLFLGAASNLYDRLLYGAVIDYVRVGTGFFNIADVMIAVALLSLIYIDSRA